jgi:hypothetical protein
MSTPAWGTNSFSITINSKTFRTVFTQTTGLHSDQQQIEYVVVRHYVCVDETADWILERVVDYVSRTQFNSVDKYFYYSAESTASSQ